MTRRSLVQILVETETVRHSKLRRAVLTAAYGRTAGRHFPLSDRILICARCEATTSGTPMYSLILPVTQIDLSR